MPDGMRKTQTRESGVQSDNESGIGLNTKGDRVINSFDFEEKVVSGRLG